MKIGTVVVINAAHILIDVFCNDLSHFIVDLVNVRPDHGMGLMGALYIQFV